jgi:hypothetical protein
LAGIEQRHKSRDVIDRSSPDPLLTTVEAREP